MHNRSEEQEFRSHLKKSARDLYPHAYLALLGLGQAVTFHLLCEDFSHLKIHDPLYITSVLLSIETLFLLILVWNDYFMVITLFNWIPSLADAALPFMLFGAEVAMAKTIHMPLYWNISCAVFGFIGFLAFQNTIYKCKLYPENRLPFVLFKNRMNWAQIILSFIMLSSITAMIVYWQYPNVASSWAVYFAIFSVLVTTLFAIHTVIAWNKVILFIRDKRSISKAEY
jgi:hypothetical protein